MEKFGKWRDKETGIHPFLPKKAPSSPGAVGVVVGLLRLPILAILFPTLFFFSFLSSLIPVPFLRRVVERTCVSVLSRLCLFFLGFHSITSLHQKLQPKTLAPQTAPGSEIKGGDVIVCNHCSFVDILYLSFRFSPLFTSVATIHDTSKGTVVKRSLYGALVDSLSIPQINDVEKARPLADILNELGRGSGPIVVFPEATTTNGDLILKCHPVLSSLKSDQIPNIHVLGFKYGAESSSATHSVGSLFSRFWQLITQPNNQLSVRYVIKKDLSAKLEETSDFQEGVFSALAENLKIQQSKLTVKDKEEFVSFWEDVAKGRVYTKANKEN